jgi:hypothetical protein
MDVSGHILVSRYIHIRTSNSGRREYLNYRKTKPIFWLNQMPSPLTAMHKQQTEPMQ